MAGPFQFPESVQQIIYTKIMHSYFLPEMATTPAFSHLFSIRAPTSIFPGLLQILKIKRKV